MSSGDGEMSAFSHHSAINVVKRVWERIAPLSLAERSWDNVI